MVSFWPFKGSDTSAASFEKLLSALSAKINRESARNDRLRQKQRRYRVLWTLYTAFAYVIAATILVLVTGLANCTALEYTGLCASPVVIYGVRAGLDAFFNYRISSSQSHLDDLNRQRDEAITRLKDATKYNSTQQLLDKYGGSTPTKSPSGPFVKNNNNSNKQETPTKKQSVPVKRTGIPPPPTANIPGRNPLPPASPPQPASDFQPRQQQLPPPRRPQLPDDDGDDHAEFAPNAFSAPAPRSSHTEEYLSNGPRWYDRLMDIVLGEDETQPKNRIVLLCQNCRLVNGQAPPGTRSLEDLGPWRCSACHALNGQESEAKLMIRKIAGDEAVKTGGGGGREDDDDVPSTSDKAQDDDDETETTPPSGATRSKVRQRKTNE